MAYKNPSYITISKHGVYYFQIRLTDSLRNKLGTIAKLYRRSLKTKDRRVALGLARQLWTELHYNNGNTWTTGMSKKSLTQTEIEKLAADAYKANQLIVTALQVEDRYNALPVVNQVTVESHMDTMSAYEQRAMQYVSDNGINLDEYRASHAPQPNFVPAPPRSINNEALASNIDTITTLQSLFDEFIADKKTNGIGASTFKAYNEQVGLFIELLQNKKIHTVHKDDIKYYKRVLPKIPSNRKKKKIFRNKSFAQLEKMPIEQAQLLSINTLNAHVTKVIAFLKWAIRNEYLPMGLEIPLESVFRKTEQNNYEVFSAEDLTKLFNSKYYTRRLHKKSWEFWTPLLGLFTGARQNEICQLHVNDLVKEGNIFFIKINTDTPDKRLKNRQSVRDIPLHKQLVSLGFVDFVAARKKRGHTRIFHELPIKDNKSNDKVSRWFNRTYRKQCQVGQGENDNKTFHSFRDTFSNTLKQNGVPLVGISELAGHGTGLTNEVYTEPYKLDIKYKQVMKLKFPSVDFAQIRLWQDKY